MIEAVSNGLMDEVSWFKKHRVAFLGGICLIQCIAAIPMVTGSGMYWVTLIDWYASGLPLMIAAGLEITCISWNYGVRRFIYDIRCMIGHRPFLWQWWTLAWVAITPICIALLIVAYIAFYSPAKYNGQLYPPWAQALGWMTAFFSILSIPATAMYQIIKHPRAKGTFLERVQKLLKCDPDWGPNDPLIDYRYRNHGSKKMDASRCLSLVGCTIRRSESQSSDEQESPPKYQSP